MTATADTAEGEELRDPEQLSDELATYSSTTSSGTAEPAEPTWRILLSTDGTRIRRDVWRDRKPWEAVAEGWEPEGIIWPTWPVRRAREMSAEEAALNGVQKYWHKSGNRLRDSAKWMATVLRRLATLAGTSPLAPIRQHHATAEVIFLLAGLALLCVTLFLIVQVMRPQAVSLNEVQRAHPHSGPFGSALAAGATSSI